MATWLEDRKALKKVAREEWQYLRPFCRTLVYVCISQMRGNLHMKSYRKKTRGGWSSKVGRREILHLADQREWIWWALGQSGQTADGCVLMEIAGRVFNQSWERASPWIRLVLEQPRFPSDEAMASILVEDDGAKC